MELKIGDRVEHKEYDLHGIITDVEIHPKKSYPMGHREYTYYKIEWDKSRIRSTTLIHSPTLIVKWTKADKIKSIEEIREEKINKLGI